MPENIPLQKIAAAIDYQTLRLKPEPLWPRCWPEVKKTIKAEWRLIVYFGVLSAGLEFPQKVLFGKHPMNLGEHFPGVFVDQMLNILQIFLGWFVTYFFYDLYLRRSGESAVLKTRNAHSFFSFLWPMLPYWLLQICGATCWSFIAALNREIRNLNWLGGLCEVCLAALCSTWLYLAVRYCLISPALLLGQKSAYKFSLHLTHGESLRIIRGWAAMWLTLFAGALIFDSPFLVYYIVHDMGSLMDELHKYLEPMKAMEAGVDPLFCVANNIIATAGQMASVVYLCIFYRVLVGEHPLRPVWAAADPE